MGLHPKPTYTQSQHSRPEKDSPDQTREQANRHTSRRLFQYSGTRHTTTTRRRDIPTHTVGSPPTHPPGATREKKSITMAMQSAATAASTAAQSYFRITLMRSAIGLPKKSSGVLAALGLHKRLRTVYHPVSPQTAGMVFAVKELVDVQEVDQALSKREMRELRRPDSGFYVERRAGAERQ